MIVPAVPVSLHLSCLMCAPRNFHGSSSFGDTVAIFFCCSRGAFSIHLSYPPKLKRKTETPMKRGDVFFASQSFFCYQLALNLWMRQEDIPGIGREGGGVGWGGPIRRARGTGLKQTKYLTTELTRSCFCFKRPGALFYCRMRSAY